jgi:methyl-accepting chemotaxis protein
MVKDAVDAMHKIEQVSGEISNIINMIEDILCQTNLPALNAGVGAARAGDSGRGFAVVASEVRAHAQRTLQAAQDVKALIGKNSSEVGHGSNRVNAAGRALSEIAEQVSQASTTIGAISTSVGKQVGMVQDMKAAVQPLDQATQHNAAMCGEMTALGCQMAGGSVVLSRALSGFRFSGDQGDTRSAQSYRAA